MKLCLKILHIRYIITLFILFISSVSNSYAQYRNTPMNQIPYYTFKVQDFNFKTENPTIHNLRYNTLYSDSLQLNLVNFNRKNIITLSYKNTDSLQSSIMNERTNNLIPPNIKFNYTQSPTSLQGLGILLMGISRTILFPSAP